MAHGIKTDKMDLLVANVCIAFCCGGWQGERSFSFPICPSHINIKQDCEI